jgi:hypothetical protein
MRIFEVAAAAAVIPKLVGLSEWYVGQSQDAAAPKVASLKTFIELAQDMSGSTITPDQLSELSKQIPLSNYIESVDTKEQKVYFKGSDAPTNTMSVPKAEKIVSTAAKRAASKRS